MNSDDVKNKKRCEWIDLARGIAITRSAYPNGNQWAAQGYSVPDPLSEGQKLRVQYYFQMVQNPGGTPNNGQIDFFMQQVYDGGTDPMNGKSPEKYLAANGTSYIESGEHMDHLTAGSDNEHVYNFNNGNCGTYANVLDNGGDINNGPLAPRPNNADAEHQDRLLRLC